MAESELPEQSGAPNLAAMQVAVGVLHGTAEKEAREFLLEQTRLARLQAKDLEEEGRLRHWSLRVRHLSDVMKVAFELAVAFIFVSIAVGLGAAIWTASHDNGLVIDAFSVPPEMASRGMTGEVVANQLLDKLTRMQKETTSTRPVQTYANNWNDDVKVQIPDTGVSVGEFYRVLRQWLGHDTHIGGEVYRTASGIAVTARTAGQDGATFTGSESDLDALIEKAAEDVYRRTQPYRFSVYAARTLRDEALARQVLAELIQEGPPLERTWAYIGLDSLDEHFPDGSESKALYDVEQSVAGHPGFVLGYNNIAGSEYSLGHDEEGSRAARRTLELLNDPNNHDIDPSVVLTTKLTQQISEALEYGDASAVHVLAEQALQQPSFNFSAATARLSLATALAMAHESGRARAEWDAAMQAYTPVDLPSATTDKLHAGLPAVRLYLGQQEAQGGVAFALDLSDWNLLEREGQTLEQIDDTVGGAGIDSNHIVAWPARALAMAEKGDIAGGEAIIARTPLDCYPCLRTRGRIAALEKDWAGADRWFARAVAAAPSIPLAYQEWGAVLLGEGKYDAAIAEFEAANKAGPHYADPLEMWGEALMQKNRSDLALAKFEQAAKFAPNWGRLHLKWGEALYFVGHKDQAREQFDLARGLDLSASDQAALAGWSARG